MLVDEPGRYDMVLLAGGDDIASQPLLIGPAEVFRGGGVWASGQLKTPALRGDACRGKSHRRMWPSVRTRFLREPGPDGSAGLGTRQPAGISPPHLQAIRRAPFAPRLFAFGLHVGHYAHVVRVCRIWSVELRSVLGNTSFSRGSDVVRAASSVG